ncbi:MAG: gluconokinase [Chloroflexi bacterium]|nr:gluconokinase [Chloroflexota bacterium]
MARRRSPFVLSIDIGSSSIRARLYDCRARGVSQAESTIARPMPVTPDGGSEDDPEALLRDVEAVVDGTLSRSGDFASDIGAVALSTYVGNVLGVDRSNRPVTPIYTYADGRSAPDVLALRGELGSEAHHQRTGAPLHTAYQAPRLRWLKRRRPAAFQAAWQWVDFGTFMYRRWLDRPDIPQSFSVASWSGMLDRRVLRWDEETLTALGVSESSLPDLADYSAAQRGLAPAYRRRWPQLAHVLFFLAVGDGAAANVGVGCVGRDRCALTAGTTGAIRAIIPGADDRVPAGLWAYRLDREYSVMGGAVTDAGSMFSWLRQTLRLPRALEAAISAQPLANSVMVLPFLRGERSPGWATNATAAIVGIRATTTPTDIVRASLEAIAFRFALIWRLLREIVPAKEIVVGGRAARSSPAWMQILADVLQTPLVGATERGTSARGAAVMALKAMGVIRSYDELPASRFERYVPHASRARAYEQALARHCGLYDILVTGQQGR